MSAELHSQTIAQLAQQLQSKAISPVELVEACIAHINSLDNQLNAFITPMFESALEAARKAETDIAKGHSLGPLHGVPFGLKDIYETAGVLTTAHSRTLIDNIPTHDATTVSKMKEAGAILLGKLATHEFAHGGPSFDLPWPPARNPWNPAHFTGGSSSGSGAAVAAGYMPVALGSDTGGSIRSPAALCGLVGMKPTYGVVSRAGVMANSYCYDHAGPLTWTVEDAAISLQALAGYDPLDPASSSADIPDYRQALEGNLKGLRVGVIRHFHETDMPASGEAIAAFEAGLSVLEGLGAHLSDVRMRTPADYQHIKVVVAESELLSIHGPVLQSRLGDFGEDFLGRVLPACLFNGADYVNAQRARREAIAEMAPIYADCDVLVCMGPGPAPLIDSWRTVEFWKKGSLTVPFNVTSGPALVQCTGYTSSGLPLSWQIAGKPFSDAKVMQVAHAYETNTDWRSQRPNLTAGTPALALPAVPNVDAGDCPAALADECAVALRRAGLTVTEKQFAMVCAAAPYVQDIRARLSTSRQWPQEPANIFVSR
ncbi:MAG: amidase [Chromatiales bacterium]|nr:amidase [Chromatiales bacterium]